jgi:hypothetical protein
MTLELLVKIIGWVMAGLPITVVLVISVYMIIGASNDDDAIKVLVMLGISMFLIGLVILALAYFTDVLSLVSV